MGAEAGERRLLNGPSLTVEGGDGPPTGFGQPGSSTTTGGHRTRRCSTMPAGSGWSTLPGPGGRADRDRGAGTGARASSRGQVDRAAGRGHLQHRRGVVGLRREPRRRPAPARAAQFCGAAATSPTEWSRPAHDQSTGRLRWPSRRPRHRSSWRWSTGRHGRCHQEPDHRPRSDVLSPGEDARTTATTGCGCRPACTCRPSVWASTVPTRSCTTSTADPRARSGPTSPGSRFR